MKEKRKEKEEKKQEMLSSYLGEAYWVLAETWVIEG
jgi:hypothetical protein